MWKLIMRIIQTVTNTKSYLSAIIPGLILTFASGIITAEEKQIGFQSELKPLVVHNDGIFQWFHPRACYLPPGSNKHKLSGVMTIQKHLHADDFYSGMYAMYQTQPGGEWSQPVEIPELAWRKESKNVILSVCDATPAWHTKTNKLIVIGTQLRYSTAGAHLYDRYRSYDAAYTVFDPETKKWTVWKLLANAPTDKKFYLFAPGCSQFHVKDDGTILLPVYTTSAERKIYTATVLKCSFDGTELKYLEHGDELKLETEKPLYEPSLVQFQNKYYLTLRNVQRGYVTSSKDGLHFDALKPWTFDDGQDLGSYNTQQHWLSHSDGLFLVYTRRGANNDMVNRHRAPLFMAQVDPKKLQVIRKTEQTIIPNRGAQMGNFGCNAAGENESWVTVTEGIFGNAARRKEIESIGANGSTFLVRILWDQPDKYSK